MNPCVVSATHLARSDDDCDDEAESIIPRGRVCAWLKRTLTHAGAAQVRRPRVLDLKLSAGKGDFLQAQKRGWLHYQMRQYTDVVRLQGGFWHG